MARRRKGKAIHGWLNIDKPQGLSSAKVVAEVKRLTGAAKAGHGGTLDPLATGVLPIALGEATKTAAWSMDGRKAYRFVVRWGIETATDDGEGEILRTSDFRPDENAINKALPLFIGEIEQIPPAYSAIKVDGKRAYRRARDGEIVEMAPRTVQVFDLKLISTPDEDHAEFEVSCGKGTYVRSLGRDIAERLGTLGHIAVLRRTAVGPFEIGQSISLDILADLGHNSPLNSYLLPVEAALDDIPALVLTLPQAERLRHGQMVRVLDAPQGPCVAMAGGQPVALAEVDIDEVRPVRVFNIQTS